MTQYVQMTTLFVLPYPKIPYLLHLSCGKIFPWHFAFSHLQIYVYSEQSRTKHLLKLFLRLSICDGTRPPGGMRSHERSPYISTEHFALNSVTCDANYRPTVRTRDKQHVTHRHAETIHTKTVIAPKKTHPIQPHKAVNDRCVGTTPEVYRQRRYRSTESLRRQKINICGQLKLRPIYTAGKSFRYLRYVVDWKLGHA